MDERRPGFRIDPPGRRLVLHDPAVRQRLEVASTGREGLRRTFADSVVDRLALIALGQAAGFSLDEIRGMFAADGRAAIDRSALAGKAGEIVATIRRLQALANGLRHAAVCPAANHSECPTFKRLLRAAGAGKLAPAPASRARRGVARRNSGRAPTGSAGPR